MGAISFASATTLSYTLWARGLIGVGAAFATVSYMKMAAVWFKPCQFAFVGGLLATAAMVGSMAGQMPLALVIRHAGWQYGLLYVGTVGLALAPYAIYSFARNVILLRHLPKPVDRTIASSYARSIRTTAITS